MSTNSTVYDVQVRYTVDDRGSQGLDHLAKSAENAESHAGGLKGALEAIGAIFVVERGFEVGKQWLIESNSHFQQMKINMAAVTSYNLGTPFERAKTQTDGLIEGWQEFSKQTVLTTTQFTEFGSAVNGAVLASGATMKQYDEIVKRGAVVSNVLAAGHAGGLQYASMELREALMGNLRKTQMLNVQLLGPALAKEGKTLEEWNTLTAKERVRIYMAAINDPAWNAAITAQSTSYEGRLSTLKDNLEIAARAIGKPLFEEIAKSIGKLNDFVKTHPKEIHEWSVKISNALITGFGVVKDVFAFIVAHKDTIIKIAEGWALMKLSGGVGGMGGLLGSLPGARTGAMGGMSGLMQNLMGITQRGAFGGLQYNAMANAPGFGLQGARVGLLVGMGLDKMSGDLGKTNTALMSFEGALAGLPGPLGLVGAALEAFHFALKFVAEAIDEMHADRVKGEGDFRATKSEFLGTHTSEDLMFSAIKHSGALSKEGNFDRQKLYTTLEKMAADSEDAQKNLKIVPKMVEAATMLLEKMGGEEIARRLRGDKPMDVEGGKKANKQDVHVTIHKIEVPASDPDRFVHKLVQKFEDIQRNPVGAENHLRGGF